MFPDRFWFSSIWKEAARAGLRQISKMVGQGNLAGASQLAKTPGVLKPSMAGSQIQHLGRGSEGLATMVAHPEHGVAVRKLYDPRGISGSEMIARKEQAGRALGDNPTFARFLGSAQTPQGGQMHFNEYVPSGTAPTGQAGAQSVRHAKVQAQKGLVDAGFAGGGRDIREGNMIYDASMGKHRVVDYIPSPSPGEFVRFPRSNPSRDRILAPRGSSPFNQNYNPSSPDSNGGMLGRLLGGKSTAGGVRSGDLSSANTLAASPGVRGTPAQSITGTRTPVIRGTPVPVQSVAPTTPLTPSNRTSVLPSSPTAVKPPQPPTQVLGKSQKTRIGY